MGESPGTVLGRAVVYNSATVIPTPFGAFNELIAPGAAAEASRDPRIAALRGHDAEQLLGRASSGTLRLSDSPGGLDMRIELPNTIYGHDVAQLIARRDLNGASFAFVVGADEWYDPAEQGGRPTRIITSIQRMYDVSIVTFPAYESTFLQLVGAARAASDWRRASNRRRMRLAASMHALPLDSRDDVLDGVPKRVVMRMRTAELASQFAPRPPLGRRRHDLPVARWVREHRPLARVGSVSSRRPSQSN